jgi:hypothetical protein
MSVNVDHIKGDFSDERWLNYLREEYMVSPKSKNGNSSYTVKDRNLDRFLLINLIESNCGDCDLENIKQL